MAKVDWKQVEIDTEAGATALGEALGLVDAHCINEDCIKRIEEGLKHLKAVYEATHADDIRRAKWFALNADRLADAQARGLLLVVDENGDISLIDRNGQVVGY
jgi:hypothetical protein